MVGSSTPQPFISSAGSYGYVAGIEDGPGHSFFGAGTAANPWLSTTTAGASMFFLPSISFNTGAIGGNFFGSGADHLFAPGDITVVARDSLGAISSQTITNATTTSFLGFVSTGTVTVLTVGVVPQAAPFWASVDNLTIAVAVPEPGTYAMLLAGLGVIGFMARRRRN